MAKLFYVINYIILLILYSLSPLVSAAAQLQASIEPVQIAIGETLTLNLELSGASDQDLQKSSEPDLTPLQDTFTARGQRRFESLQTINGVTSRQIRWQYTLEPQKTGTLTIPALSLVTATGRIFSQPLTVTVDDARQQTSHSDYYLEITISNDKPYLYQPIYYTIKLHHLGDLRDLEPMPPANDIVLERLNDWSERREQVNGKQVVISEITYLLTPMKSGKVSLAPSKVRALKPDNKRYSTGFGFSMFTDYLPIILTSSMLMLEVQPPAISQQPWLPLKKLNLTQKWEGDLSQAVVVGTPLVRTLTLTAEGMGGQSLPELDHWLQSNEAMRIRSPKPDTKRSVLADGKTPVSELKQSFSITPLVVGALTLPAIRLPWWDVEKNTLAWAELPAQTIQIIDDHIISPKNVAQSIPTRVQSESLLRFSQVQYLLLMISIISLLIALGYSWYHRRFSHRPSLKLPASPITNALVFKQSFLATEQSAEIKQWIQYYAHSHWQTDRQASLHAIAQQLIQHYEQGESAALLLKQLNSALYGHQPLELSAWKTSWLAVMSRLKAKKTTSAKVTQELLEPFNYG